MRARVDEMLAAAGRKNNVRKVAYCTKEILQLPRA